MPKRLEPEFGVQTNETESEKDRRIKKYRKLNKELHNQFDTSIDAKSIVKSLKQNEEDILSML